MLSRLSFMMAAAVVSAAMLTGCTAGEAGMHDNRDSGIFTELSPESIRKGNCSTGISCHDPQIIAAKDGKYYMIGSHMILASSEDLNTWDYISNGSSKNYIENLYSGSLDAFKYVGKNAEGGYSVWAGNIFYNERMDKYLLYFCTSSTYIKSTLALAMSDTPEGPYTYTDTLLYSGFTGSTIKDTNLYEILGTDTDTDMYLHLGGYDNNKWPNCIDPAVFTDAEGKQWMVYGSWSGGIFLLEIDPSTGLPVHPGSDADPYFGYHLIGGGHHPCEGPYIEYVPETGYYYLFVSFGQLQRAGGYQIRQFRSKDPRGPYLDMKDQVMGDEENYMSYGLKMAGNYTFPSLDTAYMAPGGQSVFKGFDGNMYITYHQRFDNGSEYHEPRVHRLFLNEDGWFVMSPFETADETELKGSDTDDLSGTFYIVDHELDVSDKIHESRPYRFSKGRITENENGAECGSYEITEDSSFIHVTLDEKEYHGVITKMTDEAGNDVVCISACGDNETIWAVSYIAPETE